MKIYRILFFVLSFVVFGCADNETKRGDEPIPAPAPTPDPTPEPTPDDPPVDSGSQTDWIPTEVAIDVRDADGNELFSDDYHGMLDCDNLSSMISYTYNGETKPLYDNKPESLFEAKSPKSRYFMPTFYGLYVDYYAYGYPCISFGEFDGTESHNEAFTINWPDGTNNKIEFAAEACKGYDSILVRVDDGDWENTIKVTFVK